MSDYLAALRSGRVLLMDGAMGTELQRAGMQPHECYELWNLTHPERVRAIHRAYVEAGAECLVTNTFQANPVALANHDLRERLVEINRAGVELARSVGGGRRFVLASVGPFNLDDYYKGRWLWDLIASLASTDALLLETWTQTSAFSLAEIAVHTCDHPVPPVLVSFAFRHGRVPGGPAYVLSVSGPERARLARRASALGLKVFGFTPADVARQANGLGVAALGVNCGAEIGVADMAAILREYRQHTDLPLFARPNAGTPWRDGERWVYPHAPAQMAAALPELLDAGACMVGGCCGTTPEHIAAFRSVLPRLQ
jgi:5-methyltetrahydrofolate--homocysteine methyltransferase